MCIKKAELESKRTGVKESQDFKGRDGKRTESHRKRNHFLYGRKRD